MSHVIRVTSLACVLTWSSVAARADVVVNVTIEGDEVVMAGRVDGGDEECGTAIAEPKPGERVVYRITADRVRRDRGPVSVILHKDDSQVLILLHPAKRYMVRGYPIAASKTRGTEAEFEKLGRFRLLGQASSQPAAVLEQKATEVSATLVNDLGRQMRFRGVFVPGDGPAAWGVLEMQRLVHPSPWPNLLPLEGMPWVWEEGVKQPATEFVYREVVLGVEEGPLAEDVFAVPEGYKKIGFTTRCGSFR